METWKIWYKRYNDKNSCIATGVLREEFEQFSEAVDHAKLIFENDDSYAWTVSRTNPWASN